MRGQYKVHEKRNKTKLRGVKNKANRNPACFPRALQAVVNGKRRALTQTGTLLLWRPKCHTRVDALSCFSSALEARLVKGLSPSFLGKLVLALLLLLLLTHQAER